MDSEDEDYSPAASSDEGPGQPQYSSGGAASQSQMESPFLTKAREAHAHARGQQQHPHLLAMQRQFSSPAAPDAFARAVDTLTNRAGAGIADRRSPAAVAAAAAGAHPAVVAQLQSQQARQEAMAHMAPQTLTLGPRTMALATGAHAASNGAWPHGTRRVRGIAAQCCCTGVACDVDPAISPGMPVVGLCKPEEDIAPSTLALTVLHYRFGQATAQWRGLLCICLPCTRSRVADTIQHRARS